MAEEKRYTHYKSLSKLSFQLSTVVKLENIFPVVFSNLKDIFNIDRLAFYRESGGCFILLEQAGFSGLPLSLAADKLPAISAKLEQFGIGAVLPCLDDNYLSAFFVVGKKTPPYSEDDLDLLKIIYTQISLVLARIKPYEKIREELKKSLKAAEEISRLKTYAVLAQGLAHELRNPLAIMLTRAELVKKHLDDREAVEKFADITIRNINRLIQALDILSQELK